MTEAPGREPTPMQLTEQQKQFFDTFGYLVFPGLFLNDIEEITAEFRAVFDDSGLAHQSDQRTCLVPFIDRRAALCGLLDDPRIRGIASGLLGEDFNYLAGDGNYYVGDTGWHADGNHAEGTYLKIAVYLDRVTRETGALRVIPGSHRRNDTEWAALRAHDAYALWGIDPAEVPSVALESTPGDVVVFNHNLMHASFGGSTQRRMFTLNLGQHAHGVAAVSELKSYIEGHARFCIDHLHTDLMRETASPERMRNLRQVMEHEGQLSVLAAEARLKLREPSRG